jgi:hypothetical protein
MATTFLPPLRALCDTPHVPASDWSLSTGDPPPRCASREGFRGYAQTRPTGTPPTAARPSPGAGPTPRCVSGWHHSAARHWAGWPARPRVSGRDVLDLPPRRLVLAFLCPLARHPPSPRDASVSSHSMRGGGSGGTGRGGGWLYCGGPLPRASLGRAGFLAISSGRAARRTRTHTHMGRSHAASWLHRWW